MNKTEYPIVIKGTIENIQLDIDDNARPNNLFKG